MTDWGMTSDLSNKQPVCHVSLLYAAHTSTSISRELAAVSRLSLDEALISGSAVAAWKLAVCVTLIIIAISLDKAIPVSGFAVVFLVTVASA